MNIDIIEQAIQELEYSEETVENIAELAALYIVRDHFYEKKSSHDTGNSFLPYYPVYIESKRKYQLHQTTEGEVIQNVKNFCRDVETLMKTVYSNTDMNKERLCLSQSIKNLYETYCQ